MLVKKVPLLFTFITLFLFSNLSNADLTPFFTENEQEKLILTQEEWVLELGQHKKFLTVTQDTQPYCVKEPGRTETEASQGPIVSIIDPKPEGDIYSSPIPVHLLVYLKSRIAPINIDTLRIKGKRGFFSLNITDRLKPFMRQPHDGENADYVIDAKIPQLGAGRYMFILSLADIQGHLEEHKAFLEVIK